jgi:drug/metabolite transporter (DMT)-like permease
MFASLVLLPIAIKHARHHFKNDWKKFLAVGLIGNFTPAILFAYAETGISSSLAGILNGLTPIFTLIVGALAFTTKINRWQILGLAVGFAGSVALSFIGTEGGLGSFNHFAVTVIFATLLYGISINLIKKFFQNMSTPVLTSLIFLTVGPIAIIYLLTTDFVPTIINNPDSWSSLFFIFLLGAVGTAFALVLFNKLIQQTTAVFASTVTYLIPIIAVAWGIID